MTGCEIMKCNDYNNGKCAYPKDTCKYREPDVGRCLTCGRYESRPSSTSCVRQFAYPENDEPCLDFEEANQ